MKLAPVLTYFVFAITALSLTACDSQQAATTPTPGTLPVSAGLSAGGVATPSPSPIHTPPVATPTPAVPTPTPVATSSYPTCVSSDSSHICIGLKLVSYESNNVPDYTEAQAVTLLTGINNVWSQCNVGFQLEVFQTVDPTTLGLPYSPNWESQTDAVREQFQDNSRFVVVGVGPWNVSTIAVSLMPGSGLYGTIVDQQYANNPLTVGHELGHYQGLYHVSDTTNLMNPYIGTNAETLDASQCATARATDLSDWTAMLRTTNQ